MSQRGPDGATKSGIVDEITDENESVNIAEEYPETPAVVSIYDVPVVKTDEGWEVLRAIHDDADLLAAAEALIDAVRRDVQR